MMQCCHSPAFKKLSVLLVNAFWLFLSAGSCATTGLHLLPAGNDAPPVYKVWPPPPQTPRIQYLGSISQAMESGSKKSWISLSFDSIFGDENVEGAMLRPYGVFADGQRVYVTDPGLCILHVFDINDKRYFHIAGAKDERLGSPIGVAADGTGRIYLTDSLLRKVLVFDREGEYLREIGSSAVFQRPAGIAIDEDRIYIVDTHAHKILVFSKKDGSPLFSFGKNGRNEGEFNYPTNIFIGKDTHLYISDSMNFRIQIFNRDGGILKSFGKLGDGSGDFSKPKGVAVDSEGHVYVADAHFDTIQIFNFDGQLLLAFGDPGRGGGEMILPAGIFIDKLDKIYVADSYNKRVQIFQYLKEKK